MAHGVQGSGVLGPGPDAPQTLFQGQGAGATGATGATGEINEGRGNFG
jgi:hypothetical protein